MSTEQSVAILGLGWLGEPLARTLMTQGWQVAGTTRDEEKAARLNAAGMVTLCWDFSAAMPARWPERLRAHTLVLCVPPGKVDDYPHTLGALARLAVAGGVQRVIFTSATSVYGGTGIKTEADAAPMVLGASVCWPPSGRCRPVPPPRCWCCGCRAGGR
ncbi:NAD(P)-binding domain-containing protein [Oceanimonas sp. NS1]|nr:NAD(P)-binding domain-containing protein [Oceanimonas sp. NS1]